MRKLLLIGLLIPFLLQAQNPICPPGVYFADPSARVWPDGRLYLYGSLDESNDYYCSRRHHVMSTDDMKDWTVHEDVFASVGPNDEVPYNDDLLFAPDCALKNDTFYLYFCQPNRDAEGVAVSTSPTGPFRDGQRINLGGYQEIDPAVFIDDDGQVYYLWGQFTLKMARMNPDMRTLDLSSIRDSVLTEDEHFFHEGAYLTKRDGLYYLVYADMSRGNIPSCIGYATSTSPFGPYQYRGVIIDNNSCNPGNWNNHGSIAEFNNQWYVFYHRSTHGADKMRQSCVEPISFNADGSIPEVRMTSHGAGKPLDAFTTIDARRSCLLHGNVQVQLLDNGSEGLVKMNKGSKAAYKYIDFGKGANQITVRVRTGKTTGGFNLKLDQPWGMHLGYVHIPRHESGDPWQTLTFPIQKVEGVHALWLDFYLLEGASELDVTIDWFRFE